MAVLSEERIYGFLGRTLDLSKSILDALPDHGTRPAPDAMRDQYHSLVNDLIAEKDNEEKLTDASWNWIWENRSNATPIQLYGRVAWINLQLLELL